MYAYIIMTDVCAYGIWRNRAAAESWLANQLDEETYGDGLPGIKTGRVKQMDDSWGSAD